jgi:hypothetical protein
MFVPRLSSSLLFRLIRFITIFDVWFLSFAIKILTKEIKNSINALVTIVLCVALELLSIFA